MRRRMWALALSLALACTACTPTGGEEQTEDREYALYFVAGGGRTDGSALREEVRALPRERGTAEGLMKSLLSGPEELELVSPFPAGTALQGVQLEEGVAYVDLSEAYGGLSGVDLSLADGCIVLTLCQLEDVRAVYLTVEGRARPFRDQLLTPTDFLLDNGFGTAEEAEVTLWFIQGEALVPEVRVLELETGDRLDMATVRALLAGPESRGLEQICPEGTSLLSLTEEGENFVLNLSDDWIEGEGDERGLLAMAQTLDELNPGVKVIFQVEGQRLERWGSLNLSQPLQVENAGADD